MGYADTSGLRLLRELSKEERLLFTTAEAQTAAVRIGIPQGYLNQLLYLLTESGWIHRLHRGLYVANKGELAEHIPASNLAIATKLVTPSGISHMDAFNFHGLTEQLSGWVYASTPKRITAMEAHRIKDQKPGLRYRWEVDGITYVYTVIRPEHFFGFEEVWVDKVSKVLFTDKERTLLDGFIAPHMFGGIGGAMAAIEEHRDEINMERLVEYALRYGDKAVTKLVLWGLEQFDVPVAILSRLKEGFHGPIAKPHFPNQPKN